MIGVFVELALVVLAAAVIVARIEYVRRAVDDELDRHRHRAGWQTVRRDPSYRPRHYLRGS